jgi:PAS domain S-box-containing protein
MFDHPTHVQSAAQEFISNASRFPVDKIGSWLSTVIQSSLDGVIVLDASGQMVLLNREAGRMFGYQATDLLGKPIQVLIPSSLREEHRAQMESFTFAKVTGRRLRIKLDMQGLRADGSEFLLSAAISRVIIRSEVFLAVILRELSSEQLGGCRLSLPEASLRNMAMSSQNAIEMEKRRFSKELYDDLGQRLSVLKLDLDWLEHSSAQDLRMIKRIAQMQHLLDNIIVRTKTIASSLRPSLLDDFGLLPAVEWMAEAFEKRTGVICTVVNAGIPSKPGDQVESAVFRMLQECLQNIERHAQATRVTIRLWHTDQHLHAMVQDDGVGLDNTSRGKAGCYGLITMQERIYTLGGSLRIKNNETRGLGIQASIPFQS